MRKLARKSLTFIQQKLTGTVLNSSAWPACIAAYAPKDPAKSHSTEAGHGSTILEIGMRGVGTVESSYCSNTLRGSSVVKSEAQYKCLQVWTTDLKRIACGKAVLSRGIGRDLSDLPTLKMPASSEVNPFQNVKD